nr:MAG TPA: hypothetical protein [Caudoviricetes sp.]
MIYASIYLSKVVNQKINYSIVVWLQSRKN